MKIISIVYIYDTINYIYNLIQNYFTKKETEYKYNIIENLDDRENESINDRILPDEEKEIEEVNFSLSNSWECEICKRFNSKTNIICEDCEINPLIVPYMREIINQIDDISLNKINYIININNEEFLNNSNNIMSSKDMGESTDESKLEDWEYLDEELLKEKIEYF